MSSVQRHQSWRLNIQAKAKDFDFKVSATSLFRHCNCSFFKFSIKLKLFRSVIRLRSEPEIYSPTFSRRYKSKLLRFIEKFRRRPKSASNYCVQTEMPRLGGTDGLLSRSVFKRDKNGVFMLLDSNTLLSVVTCLFKNALRRYMWVIIVLLVAAATACFLHILDYRNQYQITALNTILQALHWKLM